MGLVQNQCPAEISSPVVGSYQWIAAEVHRPLSINEYKLSAIATIFESELDAIRV